MKKTTRELTRLARQHGRRVERTGSDHWKLVSPDGLPVVVCASTPRNKEHWLRNIRRDLRKADRTSQ